MEDFDATFLNSSVELRRGLTNLVVLSECRQPTYGYELVKSLEKKGFPLDANTIYPLLRRLEKQGLLNSDWDTSMEKPRKYYQITPEGARFFEQLKAYWNETNRTVKQIIEEQDGTQIN
ncbi:MAG: PadR family transcriptional regulator [Chloroflexi bacterium]|jgi:DNA-binding PadR family transcriptional regulator|nr:PadR family transcriptional regulator [Chloroflexota bacterium]